ncbi:hypothetical protein M1349_04670 [Patescibacteria group bacterium]|nr:hypothetical protein [Patescibacteria group bacterium]
MKSKIIIAVIAVVILAGGYFLYSSKGGGIPLISSIVPAAPRATEKDFDYIKDPLIRKHFTAQANQTSFRIKSLSSGKGSEPSITEAVMNGEKFSFRNKTQNEKGEDTTDMIMIDSITYVKDFKDGKWWREVPKKVEGPTPTSAIEEPDDFKTDILKKKDKPIEYKELGTEKCGDLTCYKYQEIDPENKEGARTFWFDNQKYLLRREEYSFGEFTTTNEYTYDNISISVPSPVKDVPEGKSIYEMLMPVDTTGALDDWKKIQEQNNYQAPVAPANSDVPSDFTPPQEEPVQDTPPAE